MDITLFLAQLWGPVILAIGVGIFLNRDYYTQIYRDLEKHVFATFIFGVFTMTAGIAHILVHNLWGSWLEGLISFLGWGLFIKGSLFIIAPKFADKGGNFYVDKNLITVIGFVTLALGGLLFGIAYL